MQGHILQGHYDFECKWKGIRKSRVTQAQSKLNVMIYKDSDQSKVTYKCVGSHTVIQEDLGLVKLNVMNNKDSDQSRVTKKCVGSYTAYQVNTGNLG